MFPSANDSYFDPLITSFPFFSDITNSLNSKQDQDHFLLLTPNFSSFSLPSSPFYLYHHHDQDPAVFPLMDNYTTAVVDLANDVCEMEPSEKCHEKAPKQVTTKKRTTKKDRHSKINTAQGPRDRRMRLSLEVARKFFDLQDMLDFDKASKTVEWLLRESKSAIKELSRSLKRMKNGNGSSPCSSECDVMSGVFDESADVGNGEKNLNDSDKIPARKEKKIAMKTQKFRGIYNVPPCVARESRKQARARAKERTMKKMRIRKHNSGLSNQKSEDKALEIVEESGTAASQLGHNNYSYMKPSMEEVDESKELGLIEEQIVGNSFAVTGNYLQNNGILEEHPFRDFQMLPKPWEAYSNSTHLC